MLKRRISYFILQTLIFLTSTYGFSQQSFVSREVLNWQFTTKQNKNQLAQQILWFKDAAVNDENPNLPFFRKQLALPASGTVSIFLEDAIYKAVTEPNIIAQYKQLPEEINIGSYVKNGAFGSSAIVNFVPLRKNHITGAPEMLTSFSLKIIFTPSKTQQNNGQQRQKKDISESVLANGKWNKLGVTQSGIYKVDKKYFEKAKFDVSNTDVRNIKIYGKPGGMLPQANAIARDEDLVENAIQVYDFNNNNRLDDNDYLIFYAAGPVSWKFDPATKYFQHLVNYYADTAYYFITVGNSPGKRVTSKSSATGHASQAVTTFDDYAYHEEDKITDIIKYVKSGRELYGEDFRSLTGATIIEKTFDFNFPDIDVSSTAHLRTGVLARAKNKSTFDVLVNGNDLAEIVVGDVDVDYYLGKYAEYENYTDDFTPNNSKLSLKYRYNKSTLEAIGWLDFIELNVRRNLRQSTGQFAFRDSKNTTAATYNQYIIGNASQNLQVWDVSSFHDVQKQEATLENGNLTFTAANEKLNEYIAFDGSDFYTPINFGAVANQNLHGLDPADMIILAHPEFMAAAQRLAEIRRKDGLTVHIVTPQQVYNEFSSGGQDISAIRDFVRMFYKRAATNGSKKPRYLLLFGDASYDYKYRSAHNTNFIPTYQSDVSLEPWGSYCCDAYFGLLDDDEGDFTLNDDVDIAIGRIPVQTLDEANKMINKIVEYEDPNAKNAWRNTLTFIADDEDTNTHIEQTEDLISDISKETAAFNINKIYFDAYVQESGTSQARYPAAKQEINNDMGTGSLVMNYVGHGGEMGLAHEKVVEISDINSWENEYKYPLFITATCEFSRFDDPERTSAGELTYLNPKGGAIAMFTTTRVVNSSDNRRLNDKLMVNNMFQRENGKAKRIGDIFTKGINTTGLNSNTRSFTLLGDPSLRLAIPEYTVAVTKINGSNASEEIDTLKALSEATIYGEVRINGAKATSFNGVVYPVVYDKATTKTTLANDPGASEKRDFTVRENIIYKGKVSVVNGEFRFSFIVPKDISFKNGFGKLSFYAENKTTDANGYYDSVIIGGSADVPHTDDKGPEIVLFMNDSSFRPGNLVDENPMLIAKVKDDIGINTSGNGIGHDLTAVLNNGEAIILNDYYESSLNSFKEGEIRYPFHKLADGDYTLRVKVWDVSNNSAEATTTFVVASSAKLALDKIFNYPNPFSTQTTFSFEHNRPGEDLTVNIAIYAMNGQLIRELNQKINTDGNTVNTIQWDGTDHTGGQIASGMYVYRLTLKTNDGQIAQQSQRLVVIK